MDFSLWEDGCGLRSRKDGCIEGILGLWYLEYDGHYSFIHLTSLQLVSDGSGSPIQLWTEREGCVCEGGAIKRRWAEEQDSSDVLGLPEIDRKGAEVSAENPPPPPAPHAALNFSPHLPLLPPQRELAPGLAGGEGSRKWGRSDYYYYF